MPIEVTPAVQNQRDQITKQVADANIKLAELQRAYETSPDMRLERDRAELARLKSDPYTVDRRRRDIEVLEGRIAAAADTAPVAVMDDAERIEMAFAGGNPTVETTAGDQLSLHDMRSAIDAAREVGHHDVIAQEQFLPNTYSPEIVAEARARLTRSMRNGEWRQKLLSNDTDVRREFDMLCMCARSGPDEGPWFPTL